MFEQAETAIPKKYFAILTFFALANIFLLILLQPYTTPFASDSHEYIETAKYFRGLPYEFYGYRMIKPMAPVLTALFSYVFEIRSALIFLNSIFYFSIGFFVFKIIKLLFGSDKQALVGSFAFLTTYPMLEYSIAYMTDLAGWFFFIVSVWLTLLFLKKPTFKIVAINGLVSAIGFLAKESGGMGGLFFVICLFFISQEVFAKKIKYLAVYGLSFIVPFGAWQAFVYFKFHYSYYDWYLFNRTGANAYKREALRLVIKSLGASFLLGWPLALAGAIKMRQAPLEAKKIILALIPPSFSFLLWFAASSRLFNIIGLLLSALASFGMVWLFGNRRWFLAVLIGLIIVGNYFWFIFDDGLREIIKKLFWVTY